MADIISLFGKTRSSKSVASTLTITDAFDMIRGLNSNHNYIDRIKKARRHGKDSKKVNDNNINYYQSLKMNLPAFGWNISAPKDTIRSVDTIEDEHLSGYMYLDIDDYKIYGEKNVKKLKMVIEKCPSTYAAWTSYGGNGIGMLVKIAHLSKANYHATWHHVVDILTKQINDAAKELKIVMKFSFDKGTKDYTRINVLSYDPELYVCNPEHYQMIRACDDPHTEKNNKSGGSNTVVFNNRKYQVNGIKINPVIYADDYCEFVWKRFCDHTSTYLEDENRFTYVFFQRYFSLCNLIGVELQDAFQYLEDNHNDDVVRQNFFSYRSKSEVYQIGEDQYNAYENQYGTHLTNLDEYKENTIVEINKPFSGTMDEIMVFLEYLYNVNGLDKDMSREKTKAFFKAAKTAGVEKYYIIEFFSNKGYNHKYDLAIKDFNYIYNNPYYPFGIVYQITDDEKKNDDDITNHIKNSGIFKLISDKEGTIYDEDFTFVVDECEKNFYRILERCIDIYLSRGVKLNAAIVDFEKRYNEDLYETPYMHLFKTLFERRKLNLFHAKKSTYDKLREIELENTYTLKTNEYLSSIEIPDEHKYRVIWADTGVGKTTYVCNPKNPDAVRIVLVPVLPLLNNIKDNFPHVTVFHANKRDFTKDDKVFICTYQSFHILYDEIFRFHDYEDIELHVDEAHNFMSGSSKTFMNKELNFIYDKFVEFKSVTLYTGTWIDIHAPIIKDNFKIFRVIKDTPKKLNTVVYQNKMEATEKLCNKDGINFIYLQSANEIDGTLAKYVDFFIEKGWSRESILLLNSKRKDDQDFIDMIKNEQISDKHRLVFSTSVAAEGINLMNKDIKTLHFCTNESPHMIEQISSRFRNGAPHNIYIYRSKNAPVSVMNFLGVDDIQKKLIQKEQQKIEIMRNSKEFTGRKVYGKGSNQSDFDIDYLDIANQAYQLEKTYANQNPEYMANVLKNVYGWQIGEVITIEDKVDKAIMDKVNKQVKISREQKIVLAQDAYNTLKFNETSFNEVKTAFKNMPYIYTVEGADNIQKDISNEMYKIRTNILKLSEYMNIENAYKLMDIWVYKHKLSDTAFDILFSKVVVKHLHDTNDIGNADVINDKSYANIKKYFLTSKGRYPSYTETQLLANMQSWFGNSIRNVHDVFVKTKNILNISTFKDSLNRHKYRIDSLYISNEIAYEKLVMDKFIKNMHKNDKSFNKTEILSYIKKSLAPTVILSDKYARYTPQQAFDFLRSYCDVKDAGKGLYKIENLTPAIFDELTLTHQKMVVVTQSQY